MSCLNPLDPESKRTFTTDGAFHTLYSGGGGKMDGVIMENNNDNDVVASMKYIVRRLTPTECERLMGLPDGYTVPRFAEVTDDLVDEFVHVFAEWDRITGSEDKKPKTAKQVRTWLEKIANPETCPDAPRYKACGNGWATNQPRWILFRLLDHVDPDWMDGEAEPFADADEVERGVAIPVALRGNRTKDDRGKFQETDRGGSSYSVTTCPNDSLVATVQSFGENVRGEVRLCGDVSTCVVQGGGKPGQGYPAVVQSNGWGGR